MKTKILFTIILLFSIFNVFGQEYEEINPNPSFEGFTTVESWPQYPGGAEGVAKDISENIIIPPRAVKKDLHGKVTVSFIVETDGSLSEIKVVQSDNKVFDQSAVDAIQQLKKWKPAIQRGKPVKTAYQQVVSF